MQKTHVDKMAKVQKPHVDKMTKGGKKVDLLKSVAQNPGGGLYWQEVMVILYFSVDGKTKPPLIGPFKRGCRE